MTTPKRRILRLGLLVVLAVAMVVGLHVLQEAIRPPREADVTYAIARSYIAAVMEGDRKAALRLYGPDALCSPSDTYVSAEVGRHMTMLASAEVRDIRIQVQPREGIDVMPRSESAHITFIYRPHGAWRWRTGFIWLIAGPPGADGERAICHLGGS